MTNIAAIQRDRLRAAMDTYSEVVAEREQAKRAFTKGDHARAMTNALAAADDVGGSSVGRALRKLDNLRQVLVAQRSQVEMALAELDNIIQALNPTPVTPAAEPIRQFHEAQDNAILDESRDMDPNIPGSFAHQVRVLGRRKKNTLLRVALYVTEHPTIFPSWMLTRSGADSLSRAGFLALIGNPIQGYALTNKGRKAVEIIKRDLVCRCVESCADHPSTACSLSGEPHVHPDDGRGLFGRCPVHPDAPGDL